MNPQGLNSGYRNAVIVSVLSRNLNPDTIKIIIEMVNQEVFRYYQMAAETYHRSTGGFTSLTVADWNAAPLVSIRQDVEIFGQDAKLAISGVYKSLMLEPKYKWFCECRSRRPRLVPNDPSMMPEISVTPGYYSDRDGIAFQFNFYCPKCYGKLNF
jgi:hypothetical protein